MYVKFLNVSGIIECQKGKQEIRITKVLKDAK